MSSWLPGVTTARTYRREWLRADLVAGAVLTAVLVPQGMAYAELAGLPPVAGLYATLIPLLVYAVVGPSRILVMAPDSAIAPMVAATIIPLAAPDPDARLAMAGTLAVMVGVICMAGGLARFGFLTQLLSLPVRVGYLAGIAVTVLAGQVPRMIGIDADGELAIPVLADAAGKLGDINGLELLIGATCLAVILGCRRFAPRVPGVLIAVAGGTLTVWLFDLGDRVSTTGPLPAGLPTPGLEIPAAGDIAPLVLGAVGIAFVAFADTGVLSRSYATRLREDVDQDRELMALGAVNAAAGVFQGFPLSSSSSRTPVAEAAGARTQLTGVVGAAGVGVLLVAAPGLLADLPRAALAAIVVAAVLRLADAGWLRRTYRVRRSEFVLAAAALAGVVVLGVLWGVAVAVALSLLNFVRRAWRPNDAVLGRVDGLKGYHDVSRHPSARQVPGLVIFRFERRVVPRARAGPRGPRGPSRAPGGGGGRADDRRGHDGRGGAARTARRAGRAGRGAGLRRDEGPGAGAPGALRPDGRPGHAPVPPHRGHRGARPRGRPPGGVDRLGGRRERLTPAVRPGASRRVRRGPGFGPAPR